MTLIYSDNEIDGAVGAYIAPHLFDGVEKGATKVYASDRKIIDAYKEAGVEVVTTKKTKEAKTEGGE